MGDFHGSPRDGGRCRSSGVCPASFGDNNYNVIKTDYVVNNGAYASHNDEDNSKNKCPTGFRTSHDRVCL